MSSHVYGIKPPDDWHQQMVKVWEACQAAGIDPPREVERYFDGRWPDIAGVVVLLSGSSGGSHEAVTEYHDQDVAGFEVDVTKLPKDVKIIRFVNSW